MCKILKSLSGCTRASLLAAFSLTAYYYVVSSPFQTVYLNDSAGPLLIWHLRHPLKPEFILVFASLLAVFLSACAVFKRKGISVKHFYMLCVPSLMLFAILPQSARFPEFIPLAAVLLPAASVSAFWVLLIFRKREGPPGAEALT